VGILEEDQIVPARARLRARDRDHLDIHVPGRPLESDTQALHPDLLVLLLRLLDSGTNAWDQPLAEHLQQVEGGFAGRRTEIEIGLSPELQDVEVTVDEHARRSVSREENPIRFAVHIRHRLARLSSLLSARLHPCRGMASHDRVESRPRGAGLPHIHPLLRVLRLEQVAIRSEGLRMSQPQDAVWLERVVQSADHLLLRRRLQVDEQVAAADEIHPGERRIGQNVVPGEHRRVPTRLPT
jgi:hypothetical protein